MKPSKENQLVEHRASILPVAILALTCAVSCKEKPTPIPAAEPPPVASTPAPSASASQAPPVEKGVPSLIAEKFAPAGTHPDVLFPVEGALMVAEDKRIGRVNGDAIEWIGQIPKADTSYGENRLNLVVGSWPDGIGAVYTAGNGRISMPTYAPITGKGTRHVFGEGGVGFFYGYYKLGETSFVAGSRPGDMPEFIPVRGRPVARIQLTRAEAGCKEEQFTHPTDKALRMESITASPQGTLVAIGNLCTLDRPAAEIWDTAGKAKIVELTGQWGKHVSYPTLLPGRGDEVWAYGGEFAPVLRFHDGQVEVVPSTERLIQGLSASPDGKIFAFDGDTLHRYEEGKWIPMARIAAAGDAPQRDFSTFTFEGDRVWSTTRGGVYRFREGPRAEIDPCTTHFVYLYRSSYKNDAKFTYPSTQKALSTFPEVESLKLVEFGSRYSRHLGVVVKSRAQGEAVVAHVKATMKDENPRLFCMAPGGEPRTIEIKATGK